MVSETVSNYANETGVDVVAYLCCNTINSSLVTPSEMLNTIMNHNPKAIVLYSSSGNYCALQGTNLLYQRIFTMADAQQASQTLGFIKNSGGNLNVIINSTTSPDSGNNQNGGGNTSVAMSILYSITGLITLLFLIIIATGAIRAHRHPERYGPNPGYDGRPRQSRARGIAIAALETLPIIKFGNPHRAKPDPGVELENAPSQIDLQVPPPVRRRSSIPEDWEVESVDRHAPALGAASTAGAATADTATAASQEGSNNADGDAGDDHLGCPICTEDFTVGDDVRVLPCSHKFHPPCIDPWLINVSGTCPLW
jgi:hypothetical protein